MSKHTPGPWVHRTRLDHGANIGTETGYAVCDMAYDYSSLPREELKADARLICAAPELLEALKAIKPFIPKTSASEGGAAKHSENVRAADMVRAAIAKATGEQP